MNARHVIPIFGALVAFPAIYFLFPRANADDSINPDRSWLPSVADIRAAVTVGPISDAKDPRLDLFARLFKKRYRDHQRAVGIKFVGDRELKAMFEPGIARWDMAEIAGQADTESSQIFGRHFEVGIYETYITAIRKVGVLRYDPETGKQVVRFGPQFEQDGIVQAANERFVVETASRLFFDLIPLWNPSTDQPLQAARQPERSGIGVAAAR